MTHALMSSALALCLVALAGERAVNATPGTPQQPVFAPAAGGPADEGVVRGQVVDAQSGAPVSGARVRLLQGSQRLEPVASGGPPPGAPETTTDADGRFELRGVVPSQYAVEASAPDYITRRFGQLDGGPMGIPVRVPGGPVTSDIDLELTRAGEVSGRVFGLDGDGLSGVEIELLIDRYGPGGVVPGAMAFAQTEAFGVFRVRNVPPGEYIVRAYAPASMRPDPDDPSLSYVATFFPEVTEATAALPLALSPGQALFGVDFSLATVRTRTVSGQLIDPSGSPLSTTSVSLWGNPVSVLDLTFTAVGLDGRFVIEGVVPGEYALIVRDPLPTSERRWPRTVVNVVEDVSDLLVLPGQAARLTGRFVDEDRRPLPFDASGLGIGFRAPMANGFFIGGGADVVAADGTFQVDVEPGNVSISASGLPAGWAIRTVRVDGGEVMNDAVQVFSSGRNQLEVVLTNRVSAVAGIVTDDEGPVSHALVVLFPTDQDRWDAERLTRTVFTEPDGSYGFEGLASGDYQLIALAALPRNAWRDPAVLEQLWSPASSVRLRDDERRTLGLELSPTPPGLAP